MKFVLTQSLCPEGMDRLRRNAGTDATIYVADDPNPGNYLDQLRNADALIVRLAKCDAHTIENCPNLKVIGRTGVGYDSVDVQAANARGIPIVITPGANNRSVAEHTLAMIFSLAKNLGAAQREMLRGNWEIRNAHRAFELDGKTVGIIGLGAIGREVARLCRAVGMRVAGYDPFLTPVQIETLGVRPYTDYRELLEAADVVTLHIPLTEQTKNIIGRNELNLMKPTSLLINCSRGGIVDETALLDALQSGKIAGAGLDTFLHEPPSPEDPLFSAPNLLVSPHAAAQTREAVVRMAEMCVDGCLAVCRGERWPHVADPLVYQNGRWSN